MKSKVKKQTFKEYFGQANCDAIRTRLEEAFEGDKSVFIYIGTTKPDGGIKVTDAYMNICRQCVLDAVFTMVVDAEFKGLLSASNNCQKKKCKGKKSGGVR